MRVLEGKLVDSGIKVGIVAARFNEFIVSKLVAGAKDGLVRHDVSEENIDLAWVPGAFEIPLIASKMAKSETASGSRQPERRGKISSKVSPPESHSPRPARCG